MPDHPRWLRVLSAAKQNALDALDWAGHGVATLIGHRTSLRVQEVGIVPANEIVAPAWKGTSTRRAASWNV